MHRASHDALTGLPNRVRLRRPGPAGGRPRPAQTARSSACSSSTSTTSRWSTTPGPRRRRPAAVAVGQRLARSAVDGLGATTRGPARRRRVRRRWSRTPRDATTSSAVADASSQRSPSRSLLGGEPVSATASIGVATTADDGRRARTCCARPTSRCTWPRTPARAGGARYQSALHSAVVERLRAARRPGPGRRRRRVRAALPADRRLATGAHGRLRGAGALATTRPAAWSARRVHRRGRGERPDRADRRLGAAPRDRRRPRSGSARRPGDRRT